jgi:acetyl-CoA carboxylase biotin carboxyl carrier protein
VVRRQRSGNVQPTAHGPWTVDEVVALATRHRLAELEVEAAGVRIRVVREQALITTARHIESYSAADDTLAAANLATIEAPMVGTFYRALAPDAPPLVSQGDLVKEGQVLCIIEAMKLMNEIEAKVAGRIEKILVENGQPVEYGHPLFLVNPHR